MKLLLDAHAFLWFVAADARLTRRARRAIERDEAELYLSAATAWELAFKSSLGRLTLPVPALDYVADKVRRGIRMLPVDWSHAAAVEALPFHHRDPFDRLLIAQAMAEEMIIVTAHRVFRQYGARVAW